MIQLLKITINGFKSKDMDTELIFSKNQMSILYGANGIGKTTILDILYAIFDRNESRLILEKVQTIKILYKKEIENEITIDSYFDDELHYNWNEFNNSELNSFKVLYISTVRALNNYRGNFTAEALINYFKNKPDMRIALDSTYLDLMELVQYINGTNYDYLRNRVKEEKNIFIQGINMSDVESILVEHIDNKEKNKDKYESDITNLIVVASLNYLNELGKKEKKLIYNRNIEFSQIELDFLKKNMPSNIMDIIQGLSKMDFKSPVKNSYVLEIKKIIKEYIDFENEEDIIEIFNEFTGKGIFLDEKIKVNSYGNIHSLEKLSHGEKHLITLLSLIKFIGSKKDMILIDEPCIALDTIWQERLFSIFDRLSDKQLLIATQSPYLSINFMNDQVEINGGLEHV